MLRRKSHPNSSCWLRINKQMPWISLDQTASKALLSLPSILTGQALPVWAWRPQETEITETQGQWQPNWGAGEWRKCPKEMQHFCFPVKCIRGNPGQGFLQWGISTKKKKKKSSYLLQTENECLCTLDFINLPGFAQGFLNDISVVIVVLRTNVKKNQNLLIKISYTISYSFPKRKIIYNCWFEKAAVAQIQIFGVSGEQRFSIKI